MQDIGEGGEGHILHLVRGVVEGGPEAVNGPERGALHSPVERCSGEHSPAPGGGGGVLKTSKGGGG